MLKPSIFRLKYASSDRLASHNFMKYLTASIIRIPHFLAGQAVPTRKLQNQDDPAIEFFYSCST